MSAALEAALVDHPALPRSLGTLERGSESLADFAPTSIRRVPSLSPSTSLSPGPRCR
jgi:hypothetical protein